MSLSNNPEKVTIIVHDISPDLEQELIKRAKARHLDASTEASEVIERHVDREDGGIA